ncbi:anaphase-promoting complex subunit 5 [Skeletonema marinoi]|uniref:Anaphase-promoting complex subunit 5 n=1 Tax=Skeletonema marinoi TaxID=267567 RepID=A0AAD9DCL8_9STRA|nr:anaphase-promoting complex subunit 5 [Skeletonema marinoi]
MAELPSPQSIAIGTLISLYSDVNSPLFAYESLISDGNDNSRQVPAVQWQLELSRLIQQLVMKEDDGLFALLDNDPAGNEEDPKNVIEFDRHSSHDLDMTDDFLNELLGSSSSFDFSQQLLQCSSNDGRKRTTNEGNTMSSVSLGVRASQRQDAQQNGKTASCSFRIQSLSSLLDRIDDAFYNLSNASSSIDDLMNLLDEWHALLDGSHIGYPISGSSSAVAVTKTVGVDGESTFGVHLRKLCLGMEEIPFEAMSRLWMAFKSEVDDEASLDVNRPGVNKNNQLLTKNTPNWLPSSPQIERLLRRTCLHPNLETYLRQERTTITTIMEELQQTHPECPSISFFLFLSSLARGERTQALESLHRYFDYAMIHERKERAERAVMLQLGGGANSGSTGGNNNNNSGDAAAMRTSGMGGITTMASGMGGITGGMTGGVMNGMLANNAPGGGRGGGNAQSDAKIYKESNVMEYAAQSGDDECVSFANGWLALTSSSIGVGGRAKKSIYATVGGIPSDDAVGGGQLGSRGYRPLVPSASNCIGRSTLEEEAMLQHCQRRATQRGLSSLSIGTSLELARRMVYRRDVDGQLCSNDSEVVPSSTLAWDRIQRSGTGSSPSFVDNRAGAGNGMLSNQAGGAALALGQVHTDVGNMTASDVITTLGRQALAESGLWDSTGHSSFSSLSSCRAIMDSGRMTHCAEGGMNKGGSLYVDTLERISSMSDKAAAPTPEWILSASAFVHECLPPVETALMLLTKSTHLFLQQEDYEQAKAMARQACWLSSRHALFFHQGWNLLQLALIDLEASTSSPSNFESCLSPLLECLHLSEQYVMDPLRAMALSSLARVFLCMGRICKARALLNAAIPLLMQHGHVWFQAEACLTLAKCNLAEVPSREAGASASQLRQNALVQLEKAAALFEKIDDVHRLKEIYYLQSRIYQFLPSGQNKRDEAAKNFFRLNKMKQHKLTGRKQWESIHGILITMLMKC